MLYIYSTVLAPCMALGTSAPFLANGQNGAFFVLICGQRAASDSTEQLESVLQIPASEFQYGSY